MPNSFQGIIDITRHRPTKARTMVWSVNHYIINIDLSLPIKKNKQSIVDQYKNIISTIVRYTNLLIYCLPWDLPVVSRLPLDFLSMLQSFFRTLFLGRDQSQTSPGLCQNAAQIPNPRVTVEKKSAAGLDICGNSGNRYTATDGKDSNYRCSSARLGCLPSMISKNQAAIRCQKQWW